MKILSHIPASVDPMLDWMFYPINIFPINLLFIAQPRLVDMGRKIQIHKKSLKDNLFRSSLFHLAFGIHSGLSTIRCPIFSSLKARTPCVQPAACIMCLLDGNYALYCVMCDVVLKCCHHRVYTFCGGLKEEEIATSGTPWTGVLIVKKTRTGGKGPLYIGRKDLIYYRLYHI